MNLFIDTNIYLTFYHYTSDDLEELKKLGVAIKNKKISLYCTQQVIEEFRRNREAKIADALNKFNEQKLNNQFPQICKEYSEYSNLRQAIKQFEISKDAIMQKLKEDIEKNTLGADKIIEDLFAKATILSDKNAFELAKVRINLGNPPGKTGYGDAINWELLLAKAPNQSMYIITNDKDYISPINKKKLSQFLTIEWNNKKGSNICLFQKLSDFFMDKYPEIKLASELEKELAISRLVNSSSFIETREAISILTKFSDYTDDEIVEIMQAAITNNQIYWIKDDSDVSQFLENIIRGKEQIIDPNIFESYIELYRAGDKTEMIIEEDIW